MRRFAGKILTEALPELSTPGRAGRQKMSSGTDMGEYTKQKRKATASFTRWIRAEYLEGKGNMVSQYRRSMQTAAYIMMILPCTVSADAYDTRISARQMLTVKSTAPVVSLPHVITQKIDSKFDGYVCCFCEGILPSPHGRTSWQWRGSTTLPYLGNDTYRLNEYATIKLTTWGRFPWEAWSMYDNNAGCQYAQLGKEYGVGWFNEIDLVTITIEKLPPGGVLPLPSGEIAYISSIRTASVTTRPVDAVPLYKAGIIEFSPDSAITPTTSCGSDVSRADIDIVAMKDEHFSGSTTVRITCNGYPVQVEYSLRPVDTGESTGSSQGVTLREGGSGRTMDVQTTITAQGRTGKTVSLRHEPGVTEPIVVTAQGTGDTAGHFTGEVVLIGTLK